MQLLMNGCALLLHKSGMNERIFKWWGLSEY